MVLLVAAVVIVVILVRVRVSEASEDVNAVWRWDWRVERRVVGDRRCSVSRAEVVRDLISSVWL